jgi:hypothetical protein
MNRYTVTWLSGAQDQLAQIWIDSSDRQAVSQAANAIDIELATDADRKGAPVEEGLRSLYVPPLHVLFTVREPDRLVEVASVRTDSPPPSGPKTNGFVQPTNESP